MDARVEKAIMSKSAVIFMWLVFQIQTSNSFSNSESSLEHLISLFKNKGQMESQDRQILQVVMDKWRKGIELSILEDNVVYYYIESVNTDVKTFISPADKNFKAYKRFDGFKFFFVIEEERGDGMIHSIVELKENESLPNLVWAPNELSLLFETTENGVRDILAYSVGNQNFAPLINSKYDDYSPVFHPSGNYVVFLSNRDRESDSDDRVALYFIDRSSPFPPIKFSDLDFWRPNSLGNPDAIKFTSEDKLIAQVQNQAREFSVKQILDQLKQVRETEKLRIRQKEIQNLKQEKNKVNEESFEVVKSFQKDLYTVRLVFKDGVYSIQLQVNPEGVFKTISVVPKNYIKNPRGPIFILDPPYLFYRAEEKNLSRIFLYQDGRSEAISTPDENSYGLAWNGKESLLGYLIDRNETIFLTIFSINPREFVMRSRVDGVFESSNDELIRIESDERIAVRNTLGDFVPVEDESGLDFADQKDATNQKINPVYDAPFQIPKKQWLAYRQEPSSQPTELTWSISEVEREMSNLTEGVRWLSSQEELALLKEKFNVVREQAEVWIKRWDQSGDATLRTKALRWTENVNGIKSLINNAQILIEVE